MSKIKVVATSDLHGHLPDIPRCDVLAISGDICPDFLTYPWMDSRESGLKQLEWLTSTFIPWLEAQPAEEVVMTAGNHDFGIQNRYKDLVPLLPKFVYLLLDEAVTLSCGLKVYGSPWVINNPKWAFNIGPDKHHDRLEEVPFDTQLLILHGPPYAVMDRADDGDLCGSKPLRNKIEQLRLHGHLKLVTFGHIHEGRGRMMLDDIVLANVAHMNRQYEPTGEPMKFELEV